MNKNIKAPGVDIYIGIGPEYQQVRQALSSIFEISKGAVIDYYSDEAVSAPMFSKWALTQAVEGSSIFAFKADIEINSDFEWLPALSALSRKLGVIVAYPNEDSSGDDMWCALPDGSFELREFEVIDYGLPESRQVMD